MYPKKSLGQHFLKNTNVVDLIIGAAEIGKSDKIIEIGPGTGVLTDTLIKTNASVFAIEKDNDLVIKLRNRYENTKNIKIVHQDALWFNIETLKNYKVVANIPYNITSPLIRKFLENENRPEILVLMIQKEVAERILAKPHNSERGLLTLIVEFYSSAEFVTDVPRKDFYPVPNVDSAVIKIVPKKSLPLKKEEIEPFFKIVKAGFAAKRQQIHNSLAATLRLEKNIVIDWLEKSKLIRK